MHMDVGNVLIWEYAHICFFRCTNKNNFEITLIKKKIFNRERFVELFDEKARELNKLESDFSECKKKLDATNRRLVDSDYKGEYF